MGFAAALLSAVFSAAKDLLSKRFASRLDGTVSTFASFKRLATVGGAMEYGAGASASVSFNATCALE